MLVGVALDIVATPPLIDKAKSAACSAPLPPLVLYTASLMVTAIVLLSAAKATEDILGNIAPATFSALLAASEPDAPGDAKVNVALFPTASRIVPLFNANALVLA